MTCEGFCCLALVVMLLEGSWDGDRQGLGAQRWL